MTTNDMMTLRALLEKSSDSDLLREMIGFTVERLMALEVEARRTASGRRSASTSATATVTASGRPARARSS